MVRSTAISLLISGLASASAVSAAPRYEIQVDERDPLLVKVSLQNPAAILRLRQSQDQGSLHKSPACGGRALVRASPGSWRVPAGCKRVEWSTRISVVDGSSAFDIAAPAPVWDPKARLWLLTSALPWLRGDGQKSASVSISARLRGKTLVRSVVLPEDASIPLAFVVGRPVRSFVADGFTIEGYGHLPAPETDAWQRQLAAIIAAWRRDLLPSDSSFPPQMSYVWLPPPANADPGLSASANTGSVLMQYAPAPDEPVAGPRLKGGILVIGAHEGFHALGAVRGAPEWAGEGLATYFAYRGAKPNLDVQSHQLVREMINAPADLSLLNLQKAFKAGDGSAYPLFYGKGARFWAAIEQVLTVRPNGSGNLAALIRETKGFEGIAWSDGDQIARYFDRYSQGRARAIVQCFVIEDNCRIADQPI